MASESSMAPSISFMNSLALPVASHAIWVVSKTRDPSVLHTRLASTCPSCGGGRPALRSRLR
eukprot:1074791-Pyramimonas_sp.AAC.1